MKKIKLYTRPIKGNKSDQKTKINLIKKHFFYEINKPRTFKDIELRYSNKYISDEECWLKFVAGSKFNNEKRIINFSRAERIHWIFLIIDLFKFNNNNYKNYSNVVEYINPNNTRKLEIKILDYHYSLYLEYYPKDENNEHDYYLLLTAFYKGRNK